jgi:hypothetical protein
MWVGSQRAHEADLVNDPERRILYDNSHDGRMIQMSGVIHNPKTALKSQTFFRYCHDPS